MSIISRNQGDEMESNREEALLMKNLGKIFKEIFPHTKKLEVNGILSYTTDNNSEKFLKIDFRLPNQCNTFDLFPKQYPGPNVNQQISTSVPSVLSFSPKAASLNSPDLPDADVSSSRSASPPLLPPSVIQPHRIIRAVMLENVPADRSNCNDTFSKLENDLSEHVRRDRRKCRNPKRQILTSDSSSEKDTDEIDADGALSPTYDCNKRSKFSPSTGGVEELREKDIFRISDAKTYGDSAATIATPCTTFESTSSANVFLLSSPSISSGTRLQSPPAVSSPSVNQLPTQTKLTFATKSLGLNDLSEFCGLLPINSLLSRAVLPSVDNGAFSVKVTGNSSNVNQPIILTGTDALTQVCSSGLVNPSNPPTSTNPGSNIFFNSNLAAAVAAALSGVNSGTHTLHENIIHQGVSAVNTPSIALTGPSGEILGTIPLNAANLQHGIITSTQSNNMLAPSPHIHTGLNSIGASFPLQSGLNNPSSLVNTLNWLRCASTSDHIQQANVSTALTANTLSLSSINPVSLFQSLSNQQHTIQSLAANVSAAALSGVNSGTHTLHENIIHQGVSAVNTPSIALTGPSGEILGTIPLNAANLQHGIITSTQSNNMLAPSPHIHEPPEIPLALSSFPLQSGLNNPSSLVNTLNWLRCASTSDHIQQANVSTALTANTLSLSSINPVSLFQSLSNQQHTIQSLAANVSGKQHPMNSVSVGPTLALIGTLGLNSNTVNTCSAPTNANGTICSVSVNNCSASSTSLSMTPNPSINVGTSTSNNAALVAAALLRSLANSRQLQSDNETSSDSLGSTLPTSLTLITNSPTSSVPNRLNTISTEVSPGCLSSLLATKSVTSNPVNCNAPTTLTVESSNPLMAAVLNHNNNAGITPRGSIMFSCPRGPGEMNLLLSPASAHSFAATPLSTISTVPTAISFQGIQNQAPTGLALASPVLFHTPVTSSTVPKLTTLVTSTTTVTTPIVSVAHSTEQTILSRTDQASQVTNPTRLCPNEDRQSFSSADQTASAIDRILQTIKGCMNSSENRENETKIKIHSGSTRKVESSNNQITNSQISNSGDLCASVSTTEQKRTFSLKLTPVTLCVKGSAGIPDFNGRHQSNEESNSTVVPADKPSLFFTRDGDDGDSQTTGVPRVYRCRYCGKSFNRKFCRERHERLHTGVKPYTCEICDEKFIRLEDKKRHVRSLQHCLMGRTMCMRTESTSLTSEDGLISKPNPSGILPILTHALHETTQDGIEDNFTDPDEPNGIDMSDGTSNDIASECGSFDVDESPEKATVLHLEQTDQIDSNSPLLKNTTAICSEVEVFHIDEHECTPNDPTGFTIDDKHPVCKPQGRCRSALREAQTESNGASNVQNELLMKCVSAAPLNDVCDSRVSLQ
ncbi:hypothetical protein AHF37_01176 [Paragonimus kellicotti]|nr:hypothetical protein AHF37_01176 [Paragonimus kellicotti]